MNKAEEPSQSSPPAPPATESTEYVKASMCRAGCLVEFSYVWNIENFSSRLSPTARRKSLQSSIFAPRGYDTIKWRLVLYPQGLNKISSTAICLWMCETNVDAVRVFLDLSVTNANKAKIPLDTCAKTYVFTPYQSMVVAGRFDSNKSGDLVVGDKLTIVCAISVIKRTYHINGDVLKTLPQINTNHMRVVNFSRLFAEPLYSDLTIVVNDREIPVHRNILAAQSKIFATMIAKFEANSETPHKMHLTDISYEVCYKLLQFVYSGYSAPSCAEIATELLLAANRFDIDGLKTICEETLVPTINVDNVVELLRISLETSAPNLKRGLTDFITNHAEQLEGNDEFRQVMCEHPAFILQTLWVSTKKMRRA